ncbi:hypothetical protein MRQ36_13225 [Micromonospora sp. R77]|uniref:hypothetical protein n=1 Tax=Micromonospora sp. R77 TaxID=2925836 RepID=UPI001F60D4D0|nr:hypothetical protein [Micromonospora sp. R77]MCI4063488.1 hypothetical protein [Micromonospora sp. R77]
MARRGWGGSIATAIGVAAGAGAAQLGFGYGLGIINWTTAGGDRAEAAWVASLAWATWVAATSVIAGAICAQRLRDRGADEESPGGSGSKLALTLAAAVGALVTVLLVAVPARAAVVPQVGSPQAVAAGYAAAGLLTGALVALWALHSRAAAGNVIATVGWLWLLAVVAVVDGVLSGRGLTSAQLGIWQISADRGSFWIRDYFYWPGAVLATGSALVIGALAARGAARSAHRRVGAAASGAAGPLLVAVAYLLAVPRLAGIAPEQLSAHLIAPYAVIAGVGGSVLVTALAQRRDRRAAAHAGVTVPRQRTGGSDDALAVDPPDAAGGDLSEPGTSHRTPDGSTPTLVAPTVDNSSPAPRAGTRTRPAATRAASSRARSTAVPPKATTSTTAPAADPVGPTPGAVTRSEGTAEPTPASEAAIGRTGRRGGTTDPIGPVGGRAQTGGPVDGGAEPTGDMGGTTESTGSVDGGADVPAGGARSRPGRRSR